MKAFLAVRRTEAEIRDYIRNHPGDDLVWERRVPKPTEHVRTTLTACVRWKRMVVLWYGVENIEEHSIHRGGVMVNTRPRITWGATRSPATPYTLVVKKPKGAPYNPLLRFNVWSPNTDDVVLAPLPSVAEWRNAGDLEHFFSVLGSHTIAVRSARILYEKRDEPDGRVMESHERKVKTDESAIFPTIFLSTFTTKACGPCLTALPNPRTESREANRILPSADAIAELERERLRRCVFEEALVAKVFHPRRLERMMEAYGEDWLDLV